MLRMVFIFGISYGQILDCMRLCNFSQIYRKMPNLLVLLASASSLPSEEANFLIDTFPMVQCNQNELFNLVWVEKYVQSIVFVQQYLMAINFKDQH